jgi:hypothetical protein
MFSIANASSHRRRSWSTDFCGALLLVYAVVGFVATAKAAASVENSFGSWGQLASQFAITDFDGDNRPDLASVRLGQSGAHRARYLIDVHLTSGFPQSIGITAPTGGVLLTSRDVNGDSYPDLVVTTFWANQTVAILLNDGRGNFSQSDPSAFPGALPTSESSRFSKPDVIKDAMAMLSSRYLSGACEECGRALFPQIEAGRPVADGFHFAALSKGGLFFGRAPPSAAFHR